MGKHNYLRSNITCGLEKGKNSIDRAKEIIYGYSVMEKGFVKDYRGWEIDDQTLDEVVFSGNKPSGGLKSRFGHPGMSSEALGTLLGRAKNFRKDGNVVRADLYLSPTAHNTPNGDLATYVMDLAEKDPNMFGTSVVLGEFELARRLNEDGTPQKDKKGDDLPPLLRVKKILSSDVVDDPAATNGMFATQFFSDSVIPSALMTDFFDKFLSSPDAVEKTINFLTRYQINTEQKSKLNLNKQGEEDMDLTSLSLEQLKALRPDLCEQIKADALAAQKTGQEKAVNEALRNERERSSGIVELLGVEEFQPYHSIALESVKNGESFAEAKVKVQAARLATIQEGAAQTPGPNSEDVSEGELSHLDRAKKYQAEKGGSITDALKATAKKRN